MGETGYETQYWGTNGLTYLECCGAAANGTGTRIVPVAICVVSEADRPATMDRWVLLLSCWTVGAGFWYKEVQFPMWLEALLQVFMDVAQSEQTSRTIRIICTILISLVFLIAISGLFLLTFVIDGQSLLRRIVFFLLGLGILAYYLQFLKLVIGRKKKEKKP